MAQKARASEHYLGLVPSDEELHSDTQSRNFDEGGKGRAIPRGEGSPAERRRERSKRVEQVGEAKGEERECGG